MAVKMILFVIVLLDFISEFHLVPITNKERTMLYLQKYGYLEANNYRSGLTTEESIVSAVKDFQRFFGLKQTGEIDSNTLNMMGKPRCGVKDIVGRGGLARKKRYAHQGSRWKSNRLSYRISKYSYTPQLRDRKKVDEEIARSFKAWSDVTDLTFVERKRGRVNIDIRFERGQHGDANPFDGPGNALAHSFFPQYGGDVHFDEDELWSTDPSSGKNLFHIATHELGHALGLDHSDKDNSFMAPQYETFKLFMQLQADDVSAIQALYGSDKNDFVDDSNYEENLSGPAPDTSNAPSLCQNAVIDTITRTQNGGTYVFKGEFYWKISSEIIVNGHPRRITDDWNGLPNNLDASLFWSSGKTFFFKGKRYWRFTNKKMDPNYPKLISVRFEGIPDHLDAALIWGGTGETYFFKGDQYWKYERDKDPPVSDKYPRAIKYWEGVPNNIDAAFQSANGKTHFFKGDQYYRFSNLDFMVADDDPPYPRSTAIWWFNCRSTFNRGDTRRK